jgi:hypothetical protein
MPADGYRHTGRWSFTDATEVLALDAPTALSTLTRPQRLTMADELAADATERASATQVLASETDPESEHSRKIARPPHSRSGDRSTCATSDGPRDRQNPLIIHTAITHGSAIANAPRACRGTATRGRSEAKTITLGLVLIGIGTLLWSLTTPAGGTGQWVKLR